MEERPSEGAIRCRDREESFYGRYRLPDYWECSRDILFFIYEALHNLRLLIWKMKKDSLYAYILSGGAVTRLRKAVLRRPCCYLQLKEKSGRRRSGLFWQIGRLT